LADVPSNGLKIKEAKEWVTSTVD